MLMILRDPEWAQIRVMRSHSWALLLAFIFPESCEDEFLDEFTQTAVDHGILEHAAVEIAHYRDQQYIANMLLCLAWISTNEQCATRVIACGIVRFCLECIALRNQHMDCSMSLIRALSASVSCRPVLRSVGVLDMAIPFLQGLHGPEMDSIRQGFRAGSLVARLAGSDVSGIGPETLKNNPLLIQRTIDILENVLRVGPTGNYMNMKINPRLITMDLLVFAKAETNKPFLDHAVPVLIEALMLRGATNVRMVSDVVETLSLLYSDPNCRKALRAQREELVDLLNLYVVPTKYAPHVMKAKEELLSVLMKTKPVNMALVMVDGAATGSAQESERFTPSRLPNVVLAARVLKFQHATAAANLMQCDDEDDSE